MKIRNLLAAAGGAVLLLCTFASANASTITYRITFSGADFVSSGTTTAPVPVVLGQFDVTMDPTKGYTNGNTAVLDFINLPGIGASLKFNYETHLGGFAVFDPAHGGGATLPGTDDFAMTIVAFLKLGTHYGALEYTTASSPDTYVSRTGTVNIQEISTPVTTPVPATLPLFISALGGLGFAAWRRKSAA